MKRIPIALQLYSVRNELKQDLRATLRAVAEMGYQGVEFAGAPQHEAEELKSVLDELGLPCCGWHTPFAMVQPGSLDRTVAFNRILDNSRIIVPSIPEERRRSRADWLELAAFFNCLAETLEPQGFHAGYHNHHVEFTEADGETPWDTFFANTSKDVIMQLDLGNALAGGGNVVEILRRYPGRAGTVHIKPYSVEAGRSDMMAGFRPIIGEDDVPWEQVFELCETVGGTQWYIVEYESDACPPLKAVELCLARLRAMGK